MPVNVKSVVTPETLWTVSCSDFGHPFCPELCGQAAYEVWRDAFKFSLKVYTPLFLVPAVLFQRKPRAVITKTLPSILRSSAFLATLGAGTVPISCALRKILGKHVVANAFISGLGAGIASILIEHPSRRPELALYTTNHLIETLFRMAVVRGWVKPLKHGNVIVFMIAMSVISYLYNHKRHHMGNVRGIMKFLLGDKEEHHVSFGEVSTVPTTTTTTTSETVATTTSNTTGDYHRDIVQSSSQIQQNQQQNQQNQYRKQTLTRFQRELFIAFKASVRAFGVGFAVKGALTILSNLRKHFRHPFQLIKLGFVSRDTFKFGLFLTFLVGGWKFTLAVLKRLFPSSSQQQLLMSLSSHNNTSTLPPRPWQSLIAGAVAGTSMLIVPNTEIAMYFFSKAGEGLFHTAVGKGWIKPIPYGDAGLFAFCCAVLFYCCVYEPFSLRPSYWRFLRDCSNGRFNQFETVARIYCPEYFTKTGFKY